MPRRKALLIGINYTGSKYELAGCINDVEHGLCFNFFPTSNSWSDDLQSVAIWFMTSIFLMILPGMSLAFKQSEIFLLILLQHDYSYRQSA
jgi:hypothetical protein